MKKSTPALQANVFLVGHGYQIDIVNHTGPETTIHTTCRDFAGSYDVTRIATAVEIAFVNAMRKLEQRYLKPTVRMIRQTGALNQSSVISEARTLLAMNPDDKVEVHLKPTKQREQKLIRELLLQAATEDRFTVIYDA